MVRAAPGSLKSQVTSVTRPVLRCLWQTDRRSGPRESRLAGSGSHEIRCYCSWDVCFGVEVPDMRLFRRPLDEIVDVVSVVIISCATVFSAWCGFEAAKWSGVQTERYQAANSTRIAASETLDRANAEQIVDVQL